VLRDFVAPCDPVSCAISVPSSRSRIGVVAIVVTSAISTIIVKSAGDSTPDLNIWVATRASVGEPFGAPVKLPAPINSGANDFCPTPLRGGKLLFVSNRSTAESCGQGDIYLSRLHPKKGWLDPRHLRCAPDGPNSSLDEQGPSLIEVDGGHQLFFSRSSAAPNPVVPGELFVSARPDGGKFGPATAIAELNSPGNDIQPNVRKDGRELVFSSNHPYPGAQGAQDIYVSTRDSVDAPWSFRTLVLSPALSTPDPNGTCARQVGG